MRGPAGSHLSPESLNTKRKNVLEPNPSGRTTHPGSQLNPGSRRQEWNPRQVSHCWCSFQFVLVSGGAVPGQSKALFSASCHLLPTTIAYEPAARPYLRQRCGCPRCPHTNNTCSTSQVVLLRHRPIRYRIGPRFINVPTARAPSKVTWLTNVGKFLAFRRVDCLVCVSSDLVTCGLMLPVPPRWRGFSDARANLIPVE